VFEAVFPRLNPFSRIPVCGLIAQYNASGPPPGPNLAPVLMRSVLTNRILIRGFIVSDYAAQAPEFYREMGEWVRSGKVKYREDVVEGLPNVVRAFQGLLRGENFGKLLVKVGPEPTAAAA
jgi:NADPH-dependent curcumin reductase CurA